MRKIVLVVIGVFMLTFGFSQNHQMSIGLKGGNAAGGRLGGGGLNFKTFIGGNNALEFTVGGGSNHLRGSVMYEWQNSTGIADGLDWYIGIGGAVGTWNNTYVHPNGKWTYNQGLYLGAVAAIGLDWNLDPLIGLPIDLAFDMGPYIGIINSVGFGWGGSGALRYVIK
jgi:hypothetical protein